MPLRPAAGLLLAAALLGAGCDGVKRIDFTGAPSLPLGDEVPRRFDVTGSAELQVEDFVLPGTFEASFFEVAPGAVLLSRLEADLEDRVIVKRRWFSTRRFPLRCTRTRSTVPAPGVLGAGGAFEIAPGALDVWGVSYASRDAAGGCPGTGDIIVIDGSNSSPFLGLHEPAADRFTGEADFEVVINDETKGGKLTIAGRYRNRPPEALIASVAADAFDFSQGGCPPLTPGNPDYVLANRSDGLAVTFSSNGGDPDGSFRTGDLALEQWGVYRGRPGGPPAPYLFLGRGRALPTILFPTGFEYTVSLLATDHSGALDEDRCTFFVAPRP